jgi:hypothetical protein
MFHHVLKRSLISAYEDKVLRKPDRSRSFGRADRAMALDAAHVASRAQGGRSAAMSVSDEDLRHPPRSHLTFACVALVAATAACDKPHANTLSSQVGGRVLIAPGLGLAHAHVSIDQVNLYDGKAAIRKHVADTTTDDQGDFEPLLTESTNGLVIVDASGGTFVDLVTGAPVQLDPSVHLKALHWLGLFEDRSSSMYVTPVHALVEARFRYEISQLHDTTQAANEAYAHINAHFGGLDWEKVIPADLSVPAPSPTDEIRAAFVLGGLSILADDLRVASSSTPQVVHVMTLLDAAERDLGDQVLDGNDGNASAPGSGLQVGDCPPVSASCAVPEGGCQLGACRPLCDVYANTYRSALAGAIAKFIGTKAAPSVWNKTTLGSQDARTLTDSVSRNADADLFGDACIETADRIPPTISWDVAPPDGALKSGTLTLRVSATDDDSITAPTIGFVGYPDTDGDPTNNVAITTVDTQAATGHVDGPLTVTVLAKDVAGNTSMSTRTFQVDNTPPVVTLDSTGLFVDASNVWWTATQGPILHGTVTDEHPGTLQVLVGGAVVATGTIDGTNWVAQLPNDALSASGNDVTILATDGAGNTATKVQTIRLDVTPPSILVATSPVNDEILSTFSFEDGPQGSFALHLPAGTPVDLSVDGACATLHKHLHLLYAPKPDGTHGVLGSAGPLNPIALNVVVADDGVGVKPGSAQYRVLFNTGTTLDEVLSWTAMPAGTGGGTGPTSYTISLYIDGSHPIPQLGTTNGEYHIELRATDQLGRAATVSRCWNHFILAPPLDPTAGVGEKAIGFQRALFSTKLNPGPGEFGDFAEKFLNWTPAGAAVWRVRFKNYLGLSVFVKVQISQNVSANLLREFQIVDGLTNFTRPTTPFHCGHMPCFLGAPPTSSVDYVSDFSTPTVQTDLQFAPRLFNMSGNETTMEVLPVSPDLSNVFVIPARNGTITDAIPEYAMLTYLSATAPAGNGLNLIMAPSDANQPELDPTPYAEFSYDMVTLTGKVMEPPSGQFCVQQESDDSGNYFCTLFAAYQKYRALSRIKYQFNNDIETLYSFGATLSLPFSVPQTGPLYAADSILPTDETSLP